MNREAKKQNYEKEIFFNFLKLSNLNIDINSITHGNPNKQEPDILCKYINGESIGFELGRLTDPLLSSVNNSWEPNNGEYIRTRDHSSDITNKKLNNAYNTSFPTELLLYKENPIITPDNVIIPTIKPLFQTKKHNYKRIWFMSSNIVVLYESS